MRQIEEKGAAKACACEACKRNKGQPSKLTFGIVHEYRAMPRGGWKPKKLKHEGDDVFHLGVELETSAPLQDHQLPYRRYCERHDMRYGECYGDVETFRSRNGVADVNRYIVHIERCRQPRSTIDPSLGTTPASNEQAANMRRPLYHWVPKHDGSVTGPEFASQPATLEWWYAHRKQLDEMFTLLLHSGYRSHEGDKAGLHVNISTNAFGSPSLVDNTAAIAALTAEVRTMRSEVQTLEWAYYAARRRHEDVNVGGAYYGTEYGLWAEARSNLNVKVRDLRALEETGNVREGAAKHLRRFLDLIYVNKQWSRRMAQRTASSEQHWAKLDLLDDPDRREQWVAKAIQGYNNEDRYIAVNRPDNIRYEFRLPRGTLRLDRFFKNLEWTHAMIEYTRNLKGDNVIECTPVKFMAWVLKGSDYPYLRAFITEKFNAQVERTAILKGAVA